LGYICGIADRQTFLENLYDQLEDKSKIVLKKKVVRFEHGEESVTVRCEDGSVFVGDVVVGADGVHSRTRKEMQRIANEREPGLMDGDLESELLFFYDFN
jgi:FAD dependent monooxygenase